LRTRDILRLVYLCCGCGVGTSGGAGRRRGALIGRDIEGADDVLKDSRILGIFPCLHRIIAGYRTLVAAYLLGERWGSGGQHHCQHSRQQHYLPQNLASP
jgi:hypothetical protein